MNGPLSPSFTVEKISVQEFPHNHLMVRQLFIHKWWFTYITDQSTCQSCSSLLKWSKKFQLLISVLLAIPLVIQVIATYYFDSHMIRALTLSLTSIAIDIVSVLRSSHLVTIELSWRHASLIKMTFCAWTSRWRFALGPPGLQSEAGCPVGCYVLSLKPCGRFRSFFASKFLCHSRVHMRKFSMIGQLAEPSENISLFTKINPFPWKPIALW